jgi:hypothetical protein
MTSNLFLDHIIILVPYDTLLHPPPWVTDNFTLTPGGRHADGKTENKLICFADGSYLELIAFINDSPHHRSGHWWGNKPYGIIDFAFTSRESAQEQHARLASRLSGNADGVRYQTPVEGGRTRDDGQELKWHVTFPDVTTTGFQRGELPFFCHDVTDRKLRVPGGVETTTHPSSAYGVAQIRIGAPKSRAESLVRAYSAILDVPNSAGDGGDIGAFEIKRMNGIKGVGDMKVLVSSREESGESFSFDLVIGGFGERKSYTMLDMKSDGPSRIFLDLDVYPENPSLKMRV